MKFDYLTSDFGVSLSINIFYGIFATFLAGFSSLFWDTKKRFLKNITRFLILISILIHLIIVYGVFIMVYYGHQILV